MMKSPKCHMRYTKYIKAVTCPKCGNQGALKLRTNGYGKSNYVVDHYATIFGKKTYVGFCYIGIENSKDVVEVLA